MLLHYPSELPISAARDQILAALRDHQVLVLAGETGSGKTTQIPKMCLEALSKNPQSAFPNPQRLLIGVTQPRRVAALSIARRLAQELDVQYGREVGSKIRFNDETSRDTVLKVMTDGILLAEAQTDPDLRRYNCIIIDEAHERSLNIDFLLGHLKLLLPRRPDLKVVITSATIETEAFSKAFNDAPIIEVSGRLYPVEVLYRPFDHLAEELGDFTYIDAAVHAVEEIISSHPPGDILIFMPGEKDIRETRDILQGHLSNSQLSNLNSQFEIVPLFGRLSSADQERVFSPGPKPRVIIATNIAETSLTIPRIRYVIDSGLARISRYSPRTRTKRLPIEDISQSSANQRKGRCGRIAEGVCIRLYSEEEFQKRPPYTQPEIQRSNLAEVILRMKAFHLGDIESFPFLNPPQPAAIKAGYQLLLELGALDEKQQLTPLGWDLARLPVDPAIGRMIIQSIKERPAASTKPQSSVDAFSEVLVICAGLSIQDPRERPMDQKEAAEQAHRRFVDPQSDFLTLLKIWNAYDDEFEHLKTQNQMRKFCRSHFLSYLRMREWTDIHAQLEESLETVDFTSIGETITTIKAPPRPDPNRQMDQVLYAAIHRSILSGLLTHVAQRRERNIYSATANREAMIFPGSNLFGKDAEHAGRGSRRADVRSGDTQARQEPRSNVQKNLQPRWIVAGELVETSRLFARTVASIQPQWIAELAAHICKFVYQGPFWNAEQGRVLVTEKVLLGGLELVNRLVPFSKVNPKEAANIFIRSALIEEPIHTPHDFLKHNEALREKIETWQTRIRSTALPDLDEALFRFYSTRIQNVSSIPDLNRLIKEEGGGTSKFLYATDADLIGDRDLQLDSTSFPEQIEVAGKQIPLQYAYAPGEQHDGVTAKVPVSLMQHLDRAALEWSVPGWRHEQIRTLLKALPKSLRVPLMPIESKISELVTALNQLVGDDVRSLSSNPESELASPARTRNPRSLLSALASLVQQKYRVPVTPDSWAPDALPEYLKPRIEVIGPDAKPLAAGRDLPSLQSKVRTAEKNVETDLWNDAATQYERYELESWDFPDQPDQLELPTRSGVPLLAYPGLQLENSNVSLRLFRNRQEAIGASQTAIERLAEKAFERDLGWLQKDLRALNSVKDLYITLGPGDELLETAYLNIKNFLFEHAPIYPLTKAAFDQLLAQAKQRLPGHLARSTDEVTKILRLRQEMLLSKKQYPGMLEDLNALLPPRFLALVPWSRLTHFSRFLRAMLVRAERYAVNPAKDSDKARQIVPFTQTLARLRARKDLDPEQARATAELRWLIEELKVSLYAQELGTSVPVSPKRLERFLEENRLQR
jgi:ATP-dependent helicase HrpA